MSINVRNRTIFRLFRVPLALINMYKFLALALVVGVALATPTAKINPSLQSTLETKHVANIMVSFIGGNKKVVNSVENRVFTTRTERLNTLKSNLEAHAQASQQQVHKFLKETQIHFRSFWINNKIYIKGADKKLVHTLATFADVSEVEEERIIPVEGPVSAGKVEKRRLVPEVEWGIQRIEAEDAWRITNGTGVVVASIDTGVRHTHEALRDQWREDHGWLDPYDRTYTPIDLNGHGTHTMGTICGTHGVGVAPGARWISCRGCDTGSCTDSALTECGEWALCPTTYDGSNPDCSKAPALVSNSWGGSGGDLWYEDITNAWIAGGIIPLFSIGNSGTSCRTCGSPGDYRRVIGVGSTDIGDELSYFSSVGPARLDGRIKPEISAPGSDVRSAVPDSDNSYGSKSGTSMACPHAAGVTALLLSVKPNLTFGEVRQALLDGTDQNVLSTNRTCASLNDNDFPNNHFGWGVINALKVVENAKKTL